MAALKAHLLGMLGGAIWCLGNSVSFMAVGCASPAISYGLSNSAPVVAALWGIFVWKEFRDAPKGTNLLLSPDVRLLPDRIGADSLFEICVKNATGPASSRLSTARPQAPSSEEEEKNN